jgi:hypothetical protein
VRLTLRTLLAYLDDMLDPAETKRIGQKVAESEAAQELIARIKQVTRRRRLTTPPATGPNAFEPNTVAEYLDNTLPSDQVEEVEKACLESDVHLAEVAAAHQILTLVLGQPALVPPTAKQRMYGLVAGGRAARRPVAARATSNGAAGEADAHAEEDETLLLGLPLYRQQAAIRWLLPLGAILLLGILAFVVWQVLHIGENRSAPILAAANPGDTPPGQTAPETTGREGASTQGEKPINPPGGEQNANAGAANTQQQKPAVDTVKPPVRPEPPSRERHEVARYRLVPPSILLSRQSASPTEAWKRLKPDERVSTTDMLVSLPGYHSDLRLESDVDLQLWGSTYEFVNVPVLESGVILHYPTQGIDADVTLDRGAVKLRNGKENGPATVRLRFQGEIWDVQLKDPGTEIGVTLFSRHVLPYGTGEGPQADMHLFIMKGRADVRITPFLEYDNIQSTGPVPYVLSWDNKGRGAQRPAPAEDRESRALLGVFSKPQRTGLPDDAQKAIEDTYVALDAVSKRLSGPARIETGLVEMLQAGESPLLNGVPINAILAVRCLGAIDAVADLINLLDDADKPPVVRVEALYTLRHWTGRNDGMEARLYDPKNGSGALTAGGKYSRIEAEVFMQLLHTLSPEQLQSPETWAYLIENLKHDKLAIRELAFYHLRRWVPAWQKIPYNPTDPADRREMAYKKWKELIPDGKLPPPPPRTP